MAKIISVILQKGGVSKTTTAMNLGIGLAREGKKVLMVDLDPQGDLTSCLGWRDTDAIEYTIADALTSIIEDKEFDPHMGILKNDEGIDLFPSNITLCTLEMSLFMATNREKILRTLLTQLKSEYDYIIIDCMPSLGIFTVNALTASDGIIIPMNAGGLSFRALKGLIRTIVHVRKHLNGNLKVIGLLLTMVRRDNNYTKDRVAEIRQLTRDAKIPTFETYIPFSICYERAANAGNSIFIHDNVDKEYKQAYENLVKEVLSNAG